MRVLVVGAARWDTVLHVPAVPPTGTIFAERVDETVGATGAGKALNLARLGHEVHLHTVLGEDEAGERVATALRAAGVHLHIDADAERTEQHVNLMTPGGGRLSVYRSIARPREPVAVGPLVELARGCDAVSLNITDYVRTLVPALAAAGVPFWTDLHDWDGRDPYHADFFAASYLTLSDEKLGARADGLCAELARDRRLVVCTRGARGATAWAGARRVEVAPHPADIVVDTNGAGDAFAAGLMHGVQLGWTLERTLAAAAVAGATAVGAVGLASPRLTAELLAGA